MPLSLDAITITASNLTVAFAIREHLSGIPRLEKITNRTDEEVRLIMEVYKKFVTEISQKR